MIAHLSGKLFSKHATSVILDVNGVGYEVIIPLSTFYDIGEIDQTVSLRIYTHVREDTLQLYGFRTNHERELFLKLISVSGIGPKLAITMLSGMNATEITASIRTNNLVRLTSIPGVGKKTAERLVIELRDKVSSLTEDDAETAVGGKQPVSAERTADAVREDALSALLNFGYQRNAAEKALNAAIQQGGDLSVEALLRRSLQSLAKG